MNMVNQQKAPSVSGVEHEWAVRVWTQQKCLKFVFVDQTTQILILPNLNNLFGWIARWPKGLTISLEKKNPFKTFTCSETDTSSTVLASVCLCVQMAEGFRRRPTGNRCTLQLSDRRRKLQLAFRLPFPLPACREGPDCWQVGLYFTEIPVYTDFFLSFR